MYLESLAEYDETDGWSFFTLNGCPAELVLAMARLAKLASIYEATTKMEWTTFNRHPVDVIVAEVRKFVNKEDLDLHDLETQDSDVNARWNRYHCIEVWRHTILAYVCRVFTPTQDPNGIRQIRHLARVILDHIRCIPPTDIVQKQLLLPLFLAASEAVDEWSRSFAREYCTLWASASRFEHFGDALRLLEEIWGDSGTRARDVSWWGMKTGRESSSRSDGLEKESTVMEYLLG